MEFKYIVYQFNLFAVYQGGMMEYQRGELLSEGKTKRIWSVEGKHDFCIAESKDDITAGDGVKHDLIYGKAAMANQTTCNVFRLLYQNQRHLPLAFLRQIDDISFLAYRATMLPWEVVVRRKAWGSYLKRFPVEQGSLFNPPRVEFFLKTSGKKWEGYDLPEDDPYALIQPFGKVELYDPKRPSRTPFLVLYGVPGTQYKDSMIEIARETFLVLEKAWKPLGGELIDFKIEFGLLSDKELVIADVIDNDSWRVLNSAGEHIDKQAYRDGANLHDVTAKYEYVANLTAQFAIS